MEAGAVAAMGGVVPPAGQQGQFPATPQPTVVLKQPPLKQGQQPPTQQQPAAPLQPQQQQQPAPQQQAGGQTVVLNSSGQQYLAPQQPGPQGGAVTGAPGRGQDAPHPQVPKGGKAQGVGGPASSSPQSVINPAPPGQQVQKQFSPAAPGGQQAPSGAPGGPPPIQQSVPPSGISTEIKAQPQHHKFLIQKIMDETGAKVIFPETNDVDKESITIIGAKEAVAAAKNVLKACIIDLNNFVEDTMTVDPNHHRFFLARRREVLRKIEEDFGGVVVSFPRNGVASDKVSLKGAKICIEGAMATIEEIVGVREMMNKFDVNIKLPSVDAESDLILNFGRPTNVEAAKVVLGEKVTELEAEKEDKIKTKRSFMVSVSVAPEYRHKIIGRKGAVIAKLRWGGFVFSQWLKSNSVIWSGMTTE